MHRSLLLLITLALTPVAAIAAPDDSASWTADIPEDGTIVRLVHAGKGKKVALRMTPTVGRTDTIRTTNTIEMSMEMMGMTAPSIDVPPTWMDLTYAVTEVLDDGSYKAHVVVAATGMAETAAPEIVTGPILEALEGMKGFSADLHVAATGQPLSADYALPEEGELSDQLRQLTEGLGNVSAPFPAEPIGKGATWEALTRVENGGIEVFQRSQYTLLSRTKDQVSIASTVEQTLAPGASLPGLPDGAGGEVSAFSSKGDGTYNMALDRAVPDVAAVAVDLAMTVSITGEGMPMGMGMTMGMAMKTHTDVVRQTE